MDRLKLTLAGCGLAAVLTVSGCRNLRSEVPPGRPFGSPASQPSVGFSSDPHPNTGLGLGAGAGAGSGNLPGGPGMGPGLPQDSAGQFGTPPPGASDKYGAPTDNAYGPPGTSALAPPPSIGTDPSARSAPPSGAPAVPDSFGTGLPGSAPAPQ
ncbi:hypothetical protein SAMN05444166_0594 [Singulisphaera sp. GP187]|uniref:hypothetical protein n=1 Tax=Singulisphaera sp. GP187 TaxID=1882752 RepID=UPI0009296EFC|nr:hypothetical protein [Singulisphaera sp. GP187]SIN74495.1 hypothetical protein SAMN05444166_0594 [Singulisphaera sp. GP187]